ncbi:fumarate reductase flavoprotein subunit [Nocardia transvalensis]|uniref:Fumarate reductase flavoprotein subunit n=1 Tax=Nocardia transvalensis TaxID=37333 RepID=A0A7W9PHC2_9NOCA|nr:FAD-dependent oxidoreductase [Nocardia transvalensis]MBB5916196.1 fumarate reductase flavoprotein subunit [Nocardia transvalensis]
MDVDVVVIGGGGAGLAAAVSAAEQGASVVLFESERELGGSTQLSAGLFTAAGTSVQRALGIEDSAERFFQHYMDLNQWVLRPGLIHAFCENAGPTLEWLIGLGVEIPATVSGNAHQPGLARAGVEDVWRAHVPKDQGYGLVQVLARAGRAHGIEVVLGTRVESLLVEDGRVAGVVADGIEVHGASVVVTTGGFAQDPGLVDRYFPAARAAGDALFVVAAPGSRGDHLRFGAEVGASLTGHGWGLLMPTVYFQRLHHWQSGFPPASRIHIDRTGRRFMDEDAPYAVSSGIIDHHGGRGWMIFDEKARVNLASGYTDWIPERVAAEVAAGRTACAATWEELAGTLGVPAPALRASIERWNAQLPTGVDDDFRRHVSLAAKGGATRLDPIAEAPFYAAEILPAELVCTHTGLEIDAHAAVLDTTGQPVPGLFAAGEAGGGVLGQRYVGGGNAVANALTMGRVAGRSAARAHRNT